MQIVGQVEIDEYCQKILNLRWPEVPKRRNVKRIGEKFYKECGNIDLVSGGFPCQPFSFAGKKHGAKDGRNLWPEMYRVIREVRPKWVIAENVPGIIGYLDAVVLPQLETLGYWNYQERTGETKIAPFIVSASATGAPHIRERVWIIAYSLSPGKRLQQINQGRENKTNSFDDGEKKFMADSDRKWKSQQTGNLKKFWNGSIFGSEVVSDSFSLRGQRRRLARPGKASCRRPHAETEGHSWWTVEPRVGRVVNGTPRRMDRLKMLGNGQLVQNQEFNGKIIMAFENA